MLPVILFKDKMSIRMCREFDHQMIFFLQGPAGNRIEVLAPVASSGIKN